MQRGIWSAASWTLAALIAAGPVAAGGKALKGEIKIDGSSTVYLITEAAAVQFKKEHPGVNISVGISGTGGGFQKFALGETDLQDASRRIKDNEAKKCQANGVPFSAVQLGWDGIAVVIHKDNTWAKKMTLAQLKKIWNPDAPARTWKEVDAAWPDEKIDLYGPGPASGTFDYFTEHVNGTERASRKDYSASEDDNTIVQGVAGNKYALGYFGVAYYEANKHKLAVAAIAAKDGSYVEPNQSTVLSRKYPISRPLFLYLNHKSLQRPEVRAFVEFTMRRTDLVARVGYVELSALQHFREKQKLDKVLKATAAP